MLMVLVKVFYEPQKVKEKVKEVKVCWSNVSAFFSPLICRLKLVGDTCPAKKHLLCSVTAAKVNTI